LPFPPAKTIIAPWGRAILELDWFYKLDISVIYAAAIVLIAGAAEFGTWTGLGRYEAHADKSDINTPASASLGLLALLIAFSFSMALSRYETRRDLVLKEANAIGSTANFALMLPPSAQGPILSLLREYATVRMTLGGPYDSSKMKRDVARSLDLQARLWRQATAVTAAEPQSLPVNCFVASLNEINNLHEGRLTALRNQVPVVVVLMLVGSAMVAMGFTGYNAGVMGTRRQIADLVMSIMIATLIVLVMDLDRPYLGLIRVSEQALVDVAKSLGP
jgi:cellobiose-specific phosphotransferase system component IIC